MTATTSQRTYQMLENQTLWETATRVNRLFAAQGIEHAVVGGVAVCLHGYRRNTVDLDLLIRSEDAAKAHSALDANGGCSTWFAESRTALSGILPQLAVAKADEARGIRDAF